MLDKSFGCDCTSGYFSCWFFGAHLREGKRVFILMGIYFSFIEQICPFLVLMLNALVLMFEFPCKIWPKDN